MEMVIATFGGILLLLSFVMKSKCFQNNRNSLKGERISAAVIGIGLIASAVVLDIGAPLISLLTTFGITILVVLCTLFFCYWLMPPARQSPLFRSVSRVQFLGQHGDSGGQDQGDPGPANNEGPEWSLPSRGRPTDPGTAFQHSGVKSGVSKRLPGDGPETCDAQNLIRATLRNIQALSEVR